MSFLTLPVDLRRDLLMDFRRIHIIMRLSPPIPPPHSTCVGSLAIAPNMPTLLPCIGTLHNVIDALEKRATTIRTMMEMLQHGDPQLPATAALTSAAFPYILALRTAFTVGEDAVYITSSPVHGKGVFAARDLKANELVTTYPVDALRIHANKVSSDYSIGDKKPFIYLYRDASLSGSHALLEWDDYKMNSIHGESIAFYGNPARYSANACGHLLNDPIGTDRDANCMECPLVGGVVTAICVVRPVQKGHELLMGYGESYWSDR